MELSFPLQSYHHIEASLSRRLGEGLLRHGNRQQIHTFLISVMQLRCSLCQKGNEFELYIIMIL